MVACIHVETYYNAVVQLIRLAVHGECLAIRSAAEGEEGA